MGLLDFPAEWDIATLILAAAVLAVVVLVASFGLAFAWRRWKQGQRAKQARRARPPGPGPVAAPAPIGAFAKRAALRKLAKAGLPKALPKLARPSLRKLRKD